MTELITTLAALRQRISDWKTERQRIALVPTMGALHAGHLALVKEARNHAERVVVSIFVNPTQFGPNEDFDRYPRTLEADRALLAGHADAIWSPSVEQMYPQGFTTSIHLAGVSEGLCGAHRPGHFDGVATVVAKLLLQVMPDTALFGEKDYQQLCVIRRMVEDLNIPVSIRGVPTVREADGLALSSRNRYLSAEERALAPKLHEGLLEIADQLRAGQPVEALVEQQRAAWNSHGFQVEYIGLRDGQTLAPLAKYQPGARLLVAARIGKTRLIDNIAI
jgi:pantoate--beta-alanine ligase